MNTPRERHDYFPWFDWLRAISAATVMLAHASVLPWDNAGNFAVQVFFALSGWLIGGLLLDVTPAALPRFFFNRALRIWVPYYLAAAMLLGLSVMRERITPKWIEFVTYKLTFVYNLFGTQQLAKYQSAMPQDGVLNHFWSVNAEEQFYLMAPLLLVLAARHGGRRIWTWAALTAVVVFGAPYYIAIVLGVLSAITVRRFGPVHLTTVGRPVIGAVFVVSVWGLLRDFDYYLIAPLTGLCIVLLLAVPGRKTQAGTIAGGMSYPLYLNHWIGFYAAHYFMKQAPFWIATVFSSSVSITIAVGLYWFVDRQLLLRRNGWYTPRRALALTACAYAMVAIGIAYGLSMLDKR